MISNILRFSPSLFEGLDELLIPELIQRSHERAYPQVKMGSPTRV